MVEVTAEPEQVGMDGRRLARLDRHFAHYVDDGRLPGWLTLVARAGQVVHLGTHGLADVEAAAPVRPDTLWRIYSMTKPVTSVAAMMLHEEGRFELKDPVSRFLPAFGDMVVYRQGSAAHPVTIPASEEMRIWHLFTHTAGLTYGFHHVHVTDELYRNVGFDWGVPPGMDLADCCDAWASLPLAFEPGSEWNYSVATDVLGRLVEVVAGMPLDRFLRERIFEPLGMHETAFWAEPERAERLAALYIPDPANAGRAVRFDPIGNEALSEPRALSGGGGLVSTAGDYLRFCEMLRRGGELDGVRLLGPRTVEYMTRNHLPGNADLEQYGRPLFAETTYDGVGFGLGFAVVMDPAANKVPCSAGEYSWGGAASTAFWVDPAEDLVCIFMTQLLPSSTHPIRSQLRQLVHQAIVA